jgi:hypothetical protein
LSRPIYKKFDYLVDSCGRRTCCYPYAEDERNDCEYLGGSCIKECGENSYDSDSQYLNDECIIHEGNDLICCFEYATLSPEEIEEESISQEEGEIVESFVESLFESTAEVEEGSSFDEERSDIRLSEYASLNRGKLATGVALILIGVISLIGVATSKKRK